MFPHDLTRTGDGDWRYRNERVRGQVARQRVLTGDTGYAAMWHACTLHGTQPDARRPRADLASLPDRARRRQAAGIDTVNATLAGPLSLSDTRQDLAADGSAAMRGNKVLEF